MYFFSNHSGIYFAIYPKTCSYPGIFFQFEGRLIFNRWPRGERSLTFHFDREKTFPEPMLPLPRKELWSWNFQSPHGLGWREAKRWGTFNPYLFDVQYDASSSTPESPSSIGTQLRHHSLILQKNTSINACGFPPQVSYWFKLIVYIEYLSILR